MKSSDQLSERKRAIASNMHKFTISGTHKILYTNIFIFICIIIMDLMCSAVLRTIYTEKTEQPEHSLRSISTDSIEYNLKMGVRPIFRCRSYCHTFSQPEVGSILGFFVVALFHCAHTLSLSFSFHTHKFRAGAFSVHTLDASWCCCCFFPLHSFYSPRVCRFFYML